MNKTPNQYLIWVGLFLVYIVFDYLCSIAFTGLVILLGGTILSAIFMILTSSPNVFSQVLSIFHIKDLNLGTAEVIKIILFAAFVIMIIKNIIKYLYKFKELGLRKRFKLGMILIFSWYVIALIISIFVANKSEGSPIQNFILIYVLFFCVSSINYIIYVMLSHARNLFSYFMSQYYKLLQ